MRRKRIIVTIFIFLAIALGIFLGFYFRPKKEKTFPLEIPLIEEELLREETIYPEEDHSSIYNKSLVRERGQAEVFWLQNKKRYLVLNREIIELMKGITGWDQIREVPPKTLTKFSPGPLFVASDSRSSGLLIKMKNTEFVFQMNQEGKREYLSKEEFENRKYDPEDIIIVSTKIIKMLPPAPPVDHLSIQEAVKRGKIEIIGSGKYFEEGVVFLAGPYEENTAINIEKGDILLSKENRQSLVVTQDFEVFIPKGEKITLPGLWVACIDRFKAWPRKNDKFDVTLNLKDWNLKSALELFELIKIIDKKGINKEKFAQAAIWKITDNQPVDDKGRELLEEAGINPNLETTFFHLSNPNPLPGTNFVLPPELTILGLVASSIRNCPPEKRANKVICQEEIELAFETYLKKEIFPGSLSQKIDSKTLSLLISFYFSQTPIDENLTPVTQEEINQTAEILSQLLKQKGFTFPKFEVKEIKVLPSSVAEQENITFFVEGKGIKDIKLQIFDLKGEKVFESQRIFGDLFEWHLRDNAGELLPNGFYSYQMEIRGFKETESLKIQKRQLIIRL